MEDITGFVGFTPIEEELTVPSDPNSGDFNISGLGSFGSLYVSGIATVQDLYTTDAHISRFLFDRTDSTGSVGQVLISDASGIRWSNVASSAAPLQTIDILNQGTSIGLVSRINFLDGSDPNDLVKAQLSVGSTNVANVTISDRWSLNGSDIYRNSRIGINNSSPGYDLDVTGTANVTSTLNVSGNVTLNSTTESTNKDSGALVTQGGVGIEKNLIVGGGTSIGLGLTVSGNTNLNSNLVVGGATSIGLGLTVAGNTNLNSNLVVGGGTSIGLGLTVAGNTNLKSNLVVGGGTSVGLGLTVAGNTNLNSNLIVGSAASIGLGLTVGGNTDLNSNLVVGGGSTINLTLTVGGNADLNSNLVVGGGTSIGLGLIVGGNTDLNSNLVVGGGTSIGLGLTVAGNANLKSNLVVGGGTSTGTLKVSGISTFDSQIELNSSLIDINNSTASGKFDYRLSSVGTGVSWRPPGVQTQNAIWVTMDGNDSNSGYLEGDAKRTVGAAASIAQPGDTIFIRSGVYNENNPIGLRTDVSVSGQDLRLVTIVPNNPTKDVFHVRRGCLIENLNFAGSSVAVAHTNCGAVAFPPTQSDVNAGIAFSAITGYLSFGPATEGDSGRWRSPYIRNCTNFMSKSIGMKINGDHATASTIGADLKSMVCDSFTQYNENGIGVSITNNGYAQLVSIFTINCDIGIYAASGGSCDLTNSNSSFGNFGLVAVGLGATEFTGKVKVDTDPEVDTVTLKQVYDGTGIARRPYDGQALWFKINLDNYPDAIGVGTITAPLRELSSITILNGGSGFSAASPPNVTIRDADGTVQPKGPQGIIAEVSPTINDAGQIVAIDVISTGRNYLSTQNIVVDIDGNTGLATAVMAPIYYTVSAASSTTPSPTGITTVTFNEFIPYELFENDPIELRRISRILTSSHSFEYIGTGTDINTATPLKGAVPIKANEVVAKDGAQIPFTSTDQKGNFDIGEGIQIDQTTSTIRGRDFSRAIQAEVTPLILALR